MNYDNTYVSIDLDAISDNFDRICAKAGTKVMAIIKADAYGHGAIQVAKLLEGKCSFFGVSSMLEALELRQAGLESPILILGHTPVSAFPDAIRLGIRPAIFHYEDAVALSQEAVAERETQSLLERAYHGSLGLLVSTMAQRNALTKEDIDELYDILKKAEENVK